MWLRILADLQHYSNGGLTQTALTTCHSVKGIRSYVTGLYNNGWSDKALDYYVIQHV